jgi:phage terminase large subunit-like protein
VCSAEPRFATPPTGRPSLAAGISKVARVLGTPLMPWQAEAVTVGTELERGRLAYREVTIVVPRQSGKSTLAISVMVNAALSRPRQTILYLAQTRLDSRKRLLDDWAPLIVASPLGRLVRVRREFGNEALIWSNGSRIAIVSGTRTAGHGATVDLAVVDEAWSRTDDRVEQAIRPTMITRPEPQFWILSTAGDESSVWLRSKVDAGRTAASLGLTDTAAAFVEYSAPDGADPADPAVWHQCMPALGHTVTEEAIRADHELMPAAAFSRAYLCQWAADSATGWETFSADDWGRAGQWE